MPQPVAILHVMSYSHIWFFYIIPLNYCVLALQLGAFDRVIQSCDLKPLPDMDVAGTKRPSAVRFYSTRPARPGPMGPARAVKFQRTTEPTGNKFGTCCTFLCTTHKAQSCRQTVSASWQFLRLADFCLGALLSFDLLLPPATFFCFNRSCWTSTIGLTATAFPIFLPFPFFHSNEFQVLFTSNVEAGHFLAFWLLRFGIVTKSWNDCPGMQEVTSWVCPAGDCPVAAQSSCGESCCRWW